MYIQTPNQREKISIHPSFPQAPNKDQISVILSKLPRNIENKFRKIPQNTTKTPFQPSLPSNRTKTHIKLPYTHVNASFFTKSMQREKKAYLQPWPNAVRNCRSCLLLLLPNTAGR